MRAFTIFVYLEVSEVVTIRKDSQSVQQRFSLTLTLVVKSRRDFVGFPPEKFRNGEGSMLSTHAGFELKATYYGYPLTILVLISRL
jgi:hypothetical protein